MEELIPVADSDSTETDPRTIELVAEPSDAGKRLDRWLSDRIADVSRARIQALIRDGHVRSGETIREARTPVKSGAAYVVEVPAARQAVAAGEAMPLSIVYEDDSVIVIDKPAGLVVHPGAGQPDGTLINALIAHCGDSLSGIGGVRRPGIVHRLDKDTSGLLVVAKTDVAHQGLSEQFQMHGRDGRLERTYLAFAWGRPLRPKGTIDVPLARSRTNRTKIETVRGERGRAAITHYEVIDSYRGSREAAEISLMRMRLETGRTHQIRVHLAHIGHPVLGDQTYASGFKTRVGLLDMEERRAVEGLTRQALHAASLAFEHPKTARKMSFSSPLPSDLAELAKALKLPGRAIEATETGKRKR